MLIKPSIKVIVNDMCWCSTYQNTTLAMRMAHGNLCKFDPKKESIEDFCKQFEFYCVANSVQGDNAEKKKAMFLTLLGQAFAKLKVLASLTPVNKLALDAIMKHLAQHFYPDTEEFLLTIHHLMGWLKT